VDGIERTSMGGCYYPWKVLSVLAGRTYLRGL
jgi:hypothetical protein